MWRRRHSITVSTYFNQQIAAPPDLNKKHFLLEKENTFYVPARNKDDLTEKL